MRRAVRLGRRALLDLRPRQHRSDRLDLLQLIGERLADGGGGLRRLLRQAFHAALHLLPHGVEIGRGLLCRVAHAARSAVELPARLLELASDLGDDGLEARFEVADRARGVGLRLFAQALDLGERLLRLAGGVAGERGADLLGAALGGGQRVLHHAGIGPHHVVEVRALGVDRVQEADDGLVPVLQDRVDLGVRRIRAPWPR